ncbi:MAG: DUF5069 domain-containing protein [Verrucomicrobiota bacterium]
MKLLKVDLTKQAPRSARVKLGGFVILPRMLDKCRALLGGKIGEYHYNCPLDQQFLTFAGIDADALKAQVATGAGDGDVLAWIIANSTAKPNLAAIEGWSASQERRGPMAVEMREFYQECHQKLAPKREDLSSWFELLDLDDYVSFGGRA